MHFTLRKYSIATVLAFTILCFCTPVQAQYYFYDDGYYDTPLMYELGGSVGIMNCLTDIGGRKGIGKKYFKDLNIGNYEPTGSVYFGAIYRYAVGLRIEASFGKVSAYDSVLAGVDPKDIANARYNRNLSFKSQITEVAVIAEIHPLFAFVDWPAKDREPPLFSPYILGGIGFFSFNPQANINGRWVNLQPLSTEGQGFPEYPDRKPYKLNGICIPVGAGLKYELTPFINLRAEFVYRATNTDYLDDVSTTFIDKSLYQQRFSSSKAYLAYTLTDRERGLIPNQTLPGKKRGNVKDKDNYFTINFKFGLSLGRERR